MLKLWKGEEGSFHLEALFAQSNQSDRKLFSEAPQWNALDVFLNLVCMSSSVEKHVVDACACKKFQGVLDQGRICKGKKALFRLALAIVLRPFTRGYSLLVGDRL